MAVGYRPMKSKDISRCVEHLTSHPILAPRYGNLIKYLPSAIRDAIGRDSFFGHVFEEFRDSVTRFLGVGMAVFVSDEFLQEIKSTPYFWLGPELVERIAHGKSPVLSDAAVRNANSTVGLNLLVWHNTLHPEDLIRAEVGAPVMAAFVEGCRGFRLREIVVQADSLEGLHAARNFGGLYFHRAENRYGPFPEGSALDFGREPRNAGMSRDLAILHSGSWLGFLFVYDPPQFGFNRSEQRLLIAALDGGTDEEVMLKLGISLSAVKKAWRSIYGRVAACKPELVLANANAEVWTQDRGKQKKQRLLSYLREHPEELRPVSRKLMKHSSADRSPTSKSRPVLDTI